MKLQKTAIHEQTTTQLAASFNSPKVRLQENEIDRLFFPCHEFKFSKIVLNKSAISMPNDLAY